MRLSAGFTMVEVLIVITIMALLLSLGLPSFGTFLDNLKVRSAAESFMSGTQLARGEAIRRNANVDFVLTDDDVSGPGFAAVTPSGTGGNWLVRTSDLVNYIEGKFGVESSRRAIGSANPIQVAGPVGIVTFGGLGVTSLPAAATFQFNMIGGACVPLGGGTGGRIRCLNVVIAPGGQARLCDPSITGAQTAAGDTRGC